MKEDVDLTKAYILNPNGEKTPLEGETIGNNKIKVNTSTFSKGVYHISNGYKVHKFIKL